MQIFFCDDLYSSNHSTYLRDVIACNFTKICKRTFENRHKKRKKIHDSKLTRGVKLKAGGKPSTWFPPGGLVEQSIDKKQNDEDEDENDDHEDEDEEDEDEEEDEEEDEDEDEYNPQLD